MANYKKCYLEAINKLQSELNWLITKDTPDGDYERGYWTGVEEQLRGTLNQMNWKVVDLEYEECE